MIISSEELFESVRAAAADGETVTLTVNSGSMRPFLDAGDRVTLSASTVYKPGDIVLAKCEATEGSPTVGGSPGGQGSPGGDGEGSPEGARCRTCVLHTVLRHEGETLILAGTANIYQRERARVADVAARVVSVERISHRGSRKARKPGAAPRTINAASPLRRFLLRSWPSAPLLRRILLRLYYIFSPSSSK